MNIFILDRDPERAARDLCDRHVGCQIKETAQMLATLSLETGGPVPLTLAGTPYRPAHAHHPVTRWLRASVEHVAWAVEQALAAADEHVRRFRTRHSSARAVEVVAPHLLAVLPRVPFAGHVQCLPDAYRGPCAVAAYRRYYRAEKVRIARWAYGPAPAWWQAAA